MPSSRQELLRAIPPVDSFLRDERLARRTADVPRRILVDAVRAAVEQMRERLSAEPAAGVSPDAMREAILADAAERIDATTQPHFRKVINATGIVLHTGLGRAVLAPRALRQIEQELSGYSLLQVDVETGQRSKRDERIEGLLRQLTAAEAATVVNNNAAATMIVLNTIGKGREVIVSRGQIVEIGGSFRLPDVMAASGAQLVEVGTTNKTHPRDYEEAITEHSAAILRVHPSNYRIQGFTSEVSLEELAKIAHAHGLVLIDDVGAGALIDFSRFGFEPEPTLMDSIAAGADIVTSSADKLIGAAQGGIILGKSDLIGRMRKNPLARVVRADKLCLAALEATLTLFLDEQMALREVPTLSMLMRDRAEIAEQAQRIADAVGSRVPDAEAATTEGFSRMGSGSLPEQNLPTRLVAVRPSGMDEGELARRLRRHRPPIFTRTHKREVLIDPRTLLAGQEQTVIEALVAILSAGE